MTRERIAWIVSVFMLALLAFQSPGSMAPRQDDYDWVRTLIEVRRQVVNNYVDPVNDQELHEKAIDGLISDLDPYTNYIPTEREDEFNRMLDNNFSGVGISLEMLDGKALVITPIDDSPADKAGVQAGDIIVKVNGQSITGKGLEDIVKLIAGPLNSPVTLTMQRGLKAVDITMNRQQVFVPTVKGHQRNADDSWDFFVSQSPKIAYVRISQFDGRTFEDLQKVLDGDAASGKPGLIKQGLQGLILDLRFNPGGLLDEAVKTVNSFIKDGVIVRTKGRNRPEDIKKADGSGSYTGFPLVVLVNNGSASAAEIVSGSLQDNHRAVLVGQRTFGKGSVQEVVKLGDDGKDGELKLTVAYYYLPSGRLVHRKKDATDWGVEPRIVLALDDAAQHALHDSLSDAETIHRQPGTQPTTRPDDVQLDRALLVAKTLISRKTIDPSVITPQPATRPETPPNPDD